MLKRAAPWRVPYDLPRSYPEVVLWGRDVLGLPAHGNWWQIETGCVVITNLVACPVKPSRSPARGRGTGAAAGWPSMFRGYLHDEARYAA
ncbi:hypothetical protein [Streptomyces sp. NPDC087317]|uniref:hypothetical protein n=1 Tax=Streptomyces sp. NPDC087317 TaxID=3365784 RepID=UPI00382BD856